MDVKWVVWVGLGLVLGLNHVLVRFEIARKFRVLFWAVNLTDAALAVGVCFYGVPGFDQGMVRLMVALVLSMHLAQNLQHRLRWAAEDREAALDAEYREYQKIQALVESRKGAQEPLAQDP